MNGQEYQDYLKYEYKEVCEMRDYAMQVDGHDAQISALFDWLGKVTDMLGTIAGGADD